MAVWKYVGKKVLAAVLTFVFVIAVNFFLFRMLPGDPVKTLGRNQKLTREDMELLRKELSLDKPLPEQFVDSFGDSLRLEFGTSFITAQPVSYEIATRVMPTILLVGTATLFATLLGIWLGFKGAWRRGSRFDKNQLGFSLLFYSMPEGWLGMMLILLFAVHWRIFPVGGYQSSPPLEGVAHILDVARHLFLPCLALTLGYIGEYSVLARAALLEEKNQDYIITARAKGLRDKDVRKHHARPNAMLPIVTLVVLYLGFIIGGAIVIEYIFSWPGLGKYTVQAIDVNDYPAIAGIFFVLSASVIIFNLIAELLYLYLDPRVKEV